jgi:hypothetical protein
MAAAILLLRLRANEVAFQQQLTGLCRGHCTAIPAQCLPALLWKKRGHRPHSFFKEMLHAVI